MQALAPPLESLQELKFYTGLQEICQELTTFFLKNISKDLSSDILLSKRKLESLDGEVRPFVKKIHQLVLAQLEGLKRDERISEYIKQQFYLIPLEHLEQITSKGTLLKQLSPNCWDQLNEISDSPRQIVEFVKSFNEQFVNLPDWRQEAQLIISSLRRQTWSHANGVQNVPKAEAVPAARSGLFQLFLCNDPVIKEYALDALTELLEWDPLHMESAYHLIELQRLLLEEIRAQKAQDLNTNLQRKLIKAYAVSIECILLHASAGHLNAMSDDMKQEHWTGAEELEGLNISNDPEIKHWAKYAIQGIQHIKSDKSLLVNVLERLGLIVRAGIAIAAAVNKPEETPSVITQAFFDLKNAFTHIEWHANWFEELLILKKLCRYSLMDSSSFRKLSVIFKEKKTIKSNKRLLYGLVSILEYTILNSPLKEIRQEAIKMLLQYYEIDHVKTKNRVLETIQRMRDSDDPCLMTNAYAISKLLIAGGKLSSEHQLIPIKVDKPHIYENVLKFLLLRLAEIKGGFDAGGHSMITLLCTSEVEDFLPPLLKCLSELCPEFQEPDIWGNTPFHFMVRLRHLETLRYIDSELDIDINAQEFERHYTALHDAVRLQSEEATRLLLELGANPDLRDRNGNTPLHHATQLSPKLTKILLDGGADPNLLNFQGQAPLNLAIEKGLNAQLPLLLEKQAKIAEQPQGITPLMMAAKAGNVVSMETLIQLQKGILNEKEAIELICYIKRLSRKDKKENSFWQFHRKFLKSSGAYADAISSLNNSGSQKYQFGNTRLMRLAKSPRSYKKLKQALQMGADPNFANRFGQTALHFAVKHHNHKAVRLLTRHHACVNQGDVNGFTPVHLAAYEGDVRSLKRLIAKGGNPNQPNDFGETPFLIGCGTLAHRKPDYADEQQERQADNQEILEILIEAGAKTDALDPLGNNALHRAVVSGSERLILWIYREFPELMWQKNFQGMIPVESALQSNRHLDTDAIIMEGLYDMHQELVQETGNRLTLGNLLVSANEPVAFEALLKAHPELGSHKDSTQMRYSPLHMAAIKGNTDILKSYIKYKLDLNHRDAAGNTAAHLAAYYGKWEFLDLLKENNADLLLKNQDGRIPLHLAATKTNTQCISILKMFHALNEVDIRGDTPLHLACRYGRIQIIEHLWHPMQQVNDEGNTPLHEACLHGQEEALRFLIQKDENIEAKNAFGQTPLMLAAQEGHASIVNRLLIIGANLWTVDDEGDTVMHKAVFNHHTGVVKALLEREKHIIATMDGKLVDRRNHNGETVLHVLAKKAACTEKSCTQNILTLLLDASADPKAENQSKENFLHYIAFYGRTELYEALTERFPRLSQNSKDLHGLTPMHKAVLGKSLPMLKKLCSGGANIDKQDENKMTPLQLAVNTGFWKGARFLLKMGADYKQRNSDDKTIFHLIMDRDILDREGYGFLVDCIQTFPKVLLLRDARGRTPLHLLAQNNHHLGLFILRFLPDNIEENGKFVVAKDNDGRTAFDYATDCKHEKLARHIYAFPPGSLGADYKSRSKPLTASRSELLHKTD